MFKTILYIVAALLAAYLIGGAIAAIVTFVFKKFALVVMLAAIAYLVLKPARQ